MLRLDGTYGEGGGQIVRTALALSALTGRAFELRDIRAGRPQPGLKAQHLTAIEAMGQLCRARHSEVRTGSRDLWFEPGPVRPGAYRFDIGTAGSIALLLQALLPPLLFAPGPTRLDLRGGTCGRWQAPVEYLQLVLLPYLHRFADLDLALLRRGYFPRGGGQVRLTVTPRFADRQAARAVLAPFALDEPPAPNRILGLSHASEHLRPARVAERQAEAAGEALSSLGCPVHIEHIYQDTHSPGSGITLVAVGEGDAPDTPRRLGSDALGERGKPAEQVGREAAQQLLTSLRGGGAVDECLSDQLIPLLALLPGSRLLAPHVSMHLRSNIYVVEQFLPVRFEVGPAMVSAVAV